MRITGFALAIALVLVGCSSNTPPQKPDAPGIHVDAMPPDAFASTCGKPGDVGNELGVGKFCATLNDCSNNKSSGLCSNLGDETTHFCTKFCAMATGPADCGTASTCTCNAQNQCGCTPNTCL